MTYPMLMKNPRGQPWGGEVVASMTMAPKQSVCSTMGEIPHDVPDRGGTVPKKMQNPSTTSEVMLMMTMREGNIEEMIVIDASFMIKIGAMTMIVAMTTTGEIDLLIEDPLI